MMSEHINALQAQLAANKVDNLRLDNNTLAPFTVIAVDASQWGKSAQVAKLDNWRWAGLWAEDRGFGFGINACLEKSGAYLILRTQLASGLATLPSHAPFYWAADRVERGIQDLFGICFDGHPDPRRWIRHQAWGENDFPLRKGFPVTGKLPSETPPDQDYPFLKAQGASVYEIPVGPVHAGIIEPGHFRFQAIGETVLHLEERLGYVHKGIEKIAEGRDPIGLARIAGRVSGDATVSHTWVACMAMERAAGLGIPLRAAYLRAVLAERERVSNHLWDLGALCNDVGFAFGYYQFGRLREQWLRENQTYFGHRLLMDKVVPGGVSVDIDLDAINGMKKTIIALRAELSELITILDANSSLEDRFLGAGVLSVELAAALGAVGFVGRASGQAFDVRQAVAYTPYDQLNVRVPTESQGDVSSRFWIRYKELRTSLRLLEELFDKLPKGEIAKPWVTPPEDAEGFAAIESWRGEILCFVRFGANNTVNRYWPRDPSVVNWPALEKLVLGNIVPDFPVCNKSVNGSYSGHDL